MAIKYRGRIAVYSRRIRDGDEERLRMAMEVCGSELVSGARVPNYELFKAVIGMLRQRIR